MQFLVMNNTIDLLLVNSLTLYSKYEPSVILNKNGGNV